MKKNPENSYVNSSTEHSTLVITLDRAEKLNAITLDMYREITTLLQEASSNTNIKSVVIASSSNNFTSGNDIADFISCPKLDNTHPVPSFLRTVASFTKPLIASVEGAAIGIGSTLLLHCDFIYANESSYFQMPFINLGLAPEAASSLLLPKIVGERWARRLLLLGEKINAQTASDIGLITELVKGSPIERAFETALYIEKLPLQAILETKRLLQSHNWENIDKTILIELESFGKLLKSEEAQAIFAKFMSK